MNSLAPLMALIDGYGVSTGTSDVTLSFRVFGDSKKIAALRAGKDITTTRLDNAVRWFAANWPEGAEWPDSAPRPMQTIEAAE